MTHAKRFGKTLYGYVPPPGSAHNVFADRYFLKGSLIERKDRCFNVYRARDLNSDPDDVNGDVVVKMRNPKYPNRDTDFKWAEEVDLRFTTEITIHKEVSGKPHIVTVLDDGNFAGREFIVFEYAGPYNLSTFLAETTSVTVRRRVVSRILKGLDAIHARGLVHLDVNLGNVIINPYDPKKQFVRIHDFGLATWIGRTISKDMLRAFYPEIMAPEQMTGSHPFSPSTDLYQVGALLHLIVTGEFPFSGTNEEIIACHIQESVPSLRLRFPHLKITAETEAIVLRALSKHPAERFQSAAEFNAALVDLKSFFEL